jgi:hypothetical protein
MTAHAHDTSVVMTERMSQTNAPSESLQDALGQDRRSSSWHDYSVASERTDDWVEIDCPGCGVSYAGARPTRQSAQSFCAGCDYPLFLAAPPPPPPAPESDFAHRRLPGVDGKDLLGAVQCPHCAEPNRPDQAQCLRCGGGLVLIDPLPSPLPTPPPIVTVVYRRPIWWMIATATVSVLLAACAVALYWVW